MKQLNLVLLGAPGSGKGTQAVVLSEYYKIKQISLGDILRNEAHSNSELGQTVKGYMAKGVLVPDDIIKAVIENSLEKCGFILDGFPRNLNQAKMLEEILGAKGLGLDKVLYLDVSQDVAVARLSGRRICKSCGSLYHIKTMAPRVEGVCDSCSTQLSSRDDDNEDTVRRRWQVFIDETHGLIEHYAKADKLLSFNGNQDKDVVFEEIKRSLKPCDVKH
ncbi:adenylate kinase [Candidatus Omnitrophota bacterium]